VVLAGFWVGGGSLFRFRKRRKSEILDDLGMRGLSPLISKGKVGKSEGCSTLGRLRLPLQAI
jgi:hypothetical protein